MKSSVVLIRNNVVTALLVGCVAARAEAQTTSLARRSTLPTAPAPAAAMEPGADPRVPAGPTAHLALEGRSLTAVKVKPPRKYKVHDLITIVIREQRKFESDADLETKKRFDVQSQLEAFFKPVEGTLGAAGFRHGRPNVDFGFNNRVKNESDVGREDSFTTRVTGEIIDIKPNGNLVIQAKATTTFDEEETVITLTGVARATDVTADNTVLSTQLSDKVIDVQNAGAVRDGSRRGWVTKVLDLLRPI
jgi:flagellar L-ring protein precursor FlgH